VENCATCKYYYKKEDDCRRYPPMIKNLSYFNLFSTVKPKDWCGEYKIKEDFSEEVNK